MINLRASNADRDQILKFKNPVSSRWLDPNFGALVIDDRQKRVELIRAVDDLKEAYSPNMSLNSRSSLNFNSKSNTNSLKSAEFTHYKLSHNSTSYGSRHRG